MGTPWSQTVDVVMRRSRRLPEDGGHPSPQPCAAPLPLCTCSSVPAVSSCSSSCSCSSCSCPSSAAATAASKEQSVTLNLAGQFTNTSSPAPALARGVPAPPLCHQHPSSLPVAVPSPPRSDRFLSSLSAGSMNRMNVNFFICENLLFFFPFCSVSGLFFVCLCFYFCFVFIFPVCLARERRLPWGCGEPGGRGSEVAARAHGLSLSRSLCVSHVLFSFKIGIPRVEPAIEGSES